MKQNLMDIISELGDPGQFAQNQLKLDQIVQTLKELNLMSKTVFDFHTDLNGNSTPIASLSNEHLRNILQVYVSQMVSASLVLNFSTDNLNGVSRAMLGNLHQKVINEAKTTLQKAQIGIFPYFFEYFGIRGQNDPNLLKQIQQAFGRDHGLVIYSSVPAIEAVNNSDNDENEDYDPKANAEVEEFLENYPTRQQTYKGFNSFDNSITPF